MSANVHPLHTNAGIQYSAGIQYGRQGHADGQQKKFEAKGHDKQLQEAQNARHEVDVCTISGRQFNGEITRRDRYTVTIRTDDQTLIIFKHAIETIEILRGRPDAAGAGD